MNNTHLTLASIIIWVRVNLDGKNNDKKVQYFQNVNHDKIISFCWR